MRQLVPRAALLCALWLGTSNDLMAFLPSDAPMVVRTENVSQRLGGLQTAYLRLKSQRGNFATPHGLEQLESIGKYLRTVDGIGPVTSFADIVSRLHQQLRGGEPAEFCIPSDQRIISQMLLLADVSDFKGFVTADFSEANLRLRCHVDDGTQLNQLIAKVRHELASGRWGPLDFNLTGDAALVAGAVCSVTRAQFWSLSSSLALIFVIVWLLFLSVQCGLITVGPAK